jgi:hypothetical protein
MPHNRIAYFAVTVLQSLVCVVIAGCSVSVQSGTLPAKAPRQAHHQSKKAPPQKDKTTKAPQKHDDTGAKEHAKETAKETPPTKTEKDETPKKKTEEVVAPEKALKPGMSRLVVPIAVSFKDVREKLDEELPKTESRDWKRVTKPGKKHEVDVRFEIWRDPIQLSMKEHTVRVIIPVRYASEFRAKVKKPIGSGSLWLTKGETWGTKEHQQRMTVTIDLNLGVNGDYQLESSSKLVSIKHGEPPEGNACGKVGVEICVPKKELASYVEDELDEHVGKKIEKLLKKGDRKVEKLFDLRKRVDTLWSKLATPIELQTPKQLNCPTLVGEACTKSAWLAFEPKELGLSELELKGDDLGVRVELQGKLSLTTDKPNTKTPKLPKLEVASGGTVFELATSVEIPISQLTSKLNEKLAATPFRLGSGSLKFKSASISVRDGAKKVVDLELITEKEQKLGFDANVDFDVKKKLLGLTNLVPNAETKALLEKELKDFDLAALKNAIAEHSHFALDKASEALRQGVGRALSSTLPGKLQLKGTLDEIALQDFSLSEKTIEAKVVLKGPLAVEFKP